MLTASELERYDRQIMIRGFGKEGQEKLKRAKVIIAGGGGLGSPSSIYLAAAGVRQRLGREPRHRRRRGVLGR